MATTLKNYPTANVGTVSTTVYNPTTAGIQATVIGMTVSNTATSNITASVTITSGATTVYVIKDTTIPVGNSLNVLGDSKLVIEQGDVISVKSSLANSADVFISVVEVV